jgi:nucleoside-diphosphate-sugar epimerase
MPLVVTGATGFIGRHLVERLIELGADVEIVTRNKSKVPKSWCDKILILEADLRDPNITFTKRPHIVFHLASEFRDSKNIWDINVKGTRNLITACVNFGVKKFVYLSSVGVMGANVPGIFDESNQCKPRNNYERSKLKSEQLVLKANNDHGFAVSILRPSIVYGPGKMSSNDSFCSLIQFIQGGKFRYIGSDKSTYNIVYVDDVVTALLYLVLYNGENNNHIFIINDPLEWGDFVRFVQSLLHLDSKVNSVPKPLAFLAALLSEGGKVAGVKLPFSITRYKALTSKTVFSSERIKKELGFKFPYGNEIGIKKTIDFYRNNNLL